MPRLTKTLIAGTAPGPKEIILRDSDLKGFHCRISPGGTKTYALYYRSAAGRERRHKIGLFEEMSPERAREIAKDVMELVRKGRDPAAERQAAREAAKIAEPPPAPAETFKEAVEDYVKREQKGRRGNASADEVRRVLLRDFPEWLERPVASVTAPEVWKRLEEIRDGDAEGQPPVAGRPYLANHAYSYAKTFFRWCARPQIGKVPHSPMTDMEKPWRGERRRTRVYDDDELRAIWAAGDKIAADPALVAGRSWGAFTKTILLLGKRRAALASMQWAELSESEAGATWTPWRDPRREESNKRLHVTPLPALAWRIINGLPRRDGNPYVFAGRIRGGHIDPGSQFADAVKAASGVEDWISHAHRHTLETRLAQLRVPPHIRDLVLDHAPARGSGETYDHYSYEQEMREALNLWAAQVEAIVTARGVRVLR